MQAGIDSEGHRYRFGVVGAVEIRMIFNRGWGPMSPACGGTASQWLVSSFHVHSCKGGAARLSTNQSVIIANGVGVSPP